MKKALLSIAAAFVCAVFLNAQDLEKLTEIYNNGANALGNGEKTEALAAFRQALTGAAALGEPGKEMAENCKNVIPSIILSIAKDAVKDGNLEKAEELAKESLSVAKEYNNADAESDASTFIEQLASQKAATLLGAKDFAGAAAAYEELVAADPTNGKNHLYLGMSYAGLGQIDKAQAAYEGAMANGEEKTAKSQLSKLFLKAASVSLKSKNFADAVSKSLKSIEYAPSANAYKIAGTGAAQQKQYKLAAEYFTKYLELNPTAADAAQTKANIEAFKKL